METMYQFGPVGWVGGSRWGLRFSSPRREPLETRRKVKRGAPKERVQGFKADLRLGLLLLCFVSCGYKVSLVVYDGLTLSDATGLRGRPKSSATCERSLETHYKVSIREMQGTKPDRRRQRRAKCGSDHHNNTRLYVCFSWRTFYY